MWVQDLHYCLHWHFVLWRTNFKCEALQSCSYSKGLDVMNLITDRGHFSFLSLYGDWKLYMLNRTPTLWCSFYDGNRWNPSVPQSCWHCRSANSKGHFMAASTNNPVLFLKALRITLVKVCILVMFLSEDVKERQDSSETTLYVSHLLYLCDFFIFTSTTCMVLLLSSLTFTLLRF